MHFDQLGLQFVSRLPARSAMRGTKIVQKSMDRLMYGAHETAIGKISVFGLDGVLAYLGFDARRSLDKARGFFPEASLNDDPVFAREMVDQVLAVWSGNYNGSPLQLVANGTPFQRGVWSALLRIPAGQVVSYGLIADAIESPRAVRAVGSAVGSNPISLLIPCHRVIQQNGSVKNYGWGDAKKIEILKAEGLSQTRARAA